MTREEKKALKAQKKAEKEAKKEAAIEYHKYYFLANVYAVVAVEAEDESEAKEMMKDIKPQDFINFRLKKAKLIKPSLYMTEEDEEEEEEVEVEEDEKPKKKKKFGFGKKKKGGDEEDAAPEMA